MSDRPPIPVTVKSAVLFKQFQDNPSFKIWLTDTVFGLTYDEPAEL
jgi:hypothetical protein